MFNTPEFYNLVLTGLVLAVLVYLFYRDNKRLPDINELTQKIEQSNAIYAEIQRQVALTENMSREERIKHIVTIIHQDYPKFNLDGITTTVASLIDASIRRR